MVSLEPGYRWQIGRLDFNFDIINQSRSFQQYRDFAERYQLAPNICDLSDRELAANLSREDYIRVVQKSPLWLFLRELASGTASSLGKYIKGPCQHPDQAQVCQAWADKLAHAPFVKTHTVTGHMRWGVGYEDPALTHFAVDRLVRVLQVGCIYLPLGYLLDAARGRFSGVSGMTALIDSIKLCDDGGREKYLLVSPDGMVVPLGEPAEPTAEPAEPDLIGMLEIKCISPFHHMPESDGLLSWADDMENRQWYSPLRIPFVYVVQICLQALAGMYKYDMKPEHTMWFVRWSPTGFSEFSITFADLIDLGLLSSLLYFSLLQRVASPEEATYTEFERPAERELEKAYKTIMQKMTHRYVSLEGLYPEFFTYQECTQRYHFSAWDKGA